MAETARQLKLAESFESEIRGTQSPDSFSIGESYYGQIDPKLDKLLEPFPELWGYKFELTHLHRTSYYEWSDAKRAEIEFDAMITEDLAWFSDRPELKRCLRHVQRAVHQIIWGDAYRGRRQKYLQTSRKSFTFSEGQTEKKAWWKFW